MLESLGIVFCIILVLLLVGIQVRAFVTYYTNLRYVQLCYRISDMSQRFADAYQTDIVTAEHMPAILGYIRSPYPDFFPRTSMEEYEQFTRGDPVFLNKDTDFALKDTKAFVQQVLRSVDGKYYVTLDFGDEDGDIPNVLYAVEDVEPDLSAYFESNEGSRTGRTSGTTQNESNVPKQCGGGPSGASVFIPNPEGSPGIDGSKLSLNHIADTVHVPSVRDQHED